jgi:hypothetical protein
MLLPRFPRAHRTTRPAIWKALAFTDYRSPRVLGAITVRQRQALGIANSVRPWSANRKTLDDRRVHEPMQQPVHVRPIRCTRSTARRLRRAPAGPRSARRASSAEAVARHRCSRVAPGDRASPRPACGARPIFASVVHAVAALAAASSFRSSRARSPLLEIALADRGLHGLGPVAPCRERDQVRDLPVDLLECPA